MSSEDPRYNKTTPRKPLMWGIGLAILVAIIVIIVISSVSLTEDQMDDDESFTNASMVALVSSPDQISDESHSAA
jgi:hypothetical protein